MKKQSTKQLLEAFGLTIKEAEVYLAIQRQGRVAPADLSDLTNINRTTVYSVAKELLNKGIIIEDLGSPKKELLASPPEDLRRMIDQELDIIKQKEAILGDIVTDIKDIALDAAYPVPSIQFIKENRIESFLYDRTPVWDESILAGDGSYLGFQEEEFVNKYADWIDWYWDRANEQIHLRLLSNDSSAEKQISSKGHRNREIIFWKNDLKFTATTWVMGDYVVMFVLSSSPNYLVEIHDARFAQNQRALFKGILADIDARA